jgi:serine phosphatase RsbU (regulator of sigma subunit)
MHVMDAKIDEYKKLSFRINRQKDILAELGTRMIRQKKEIDLQESQIGRQRTVILLIAGLSVVGIVLLLITLRINSQRRKANKLLHSQKTEIERQKHLVDLKQKEILDSINYARRIQNALMASNKLLDDHLPEYFVMFKPKDIVAGDFYWAAPLKDGFLYITADSTGHGVPGAFMSLLNISKLNDAINQKRIHRPDLVLNEVKSEIIKALNPDGSSEEGKDGMDAVLCKLDFTNLKLQYAAANNTFCIVRKGEMLLCKPDKMPVGKSHDDSQLFTYNEIALEKGDMIYTFTDGYADQFGGPDGKKLKLQKLKNLLVSVATMDMALQKENIRKFFLDWKGDLEQVDDVLVIGVRV